MLNWTTGPANLAHAAKLTGLTHVVTSKAFIDRTHIEVPGTKYVFLEDVRASVGKLELLRRLLAVRCFRRHGEAERARPAAHRPARAGGGAVHQRLGEGPEGGAADARATSSPTSAARSPPQKLTRADSVLGFLPMFHSFGLTITGLLPAARRGQGRPPPRPDRRRGPGPQGGGVQADASLVGTPTFLGFILDRCKPGDLDSLRLIVVGAEKCPDGSSTGVAQLAPQARVLEGYGITECSPVRVGQPGRTRSGAARIGKPLPGVEVVRRRSGDRRPRCRRARWACCSSAGRRLPRLPRARRPSRRSARLDGKRWYVTGDLAALDADGYIVFHGRLKRFLKAGGEMISLPALEEPFAKVYPPTDDGPRVAVEGVELPGGGRRVVLFTTEDLTAKEANAVLAKEGFRGVMRLDEVRKVDKIPVLGTGKTDYKVLRAMIEA